MKICTGFNMEFRLLTTHQGQNTKVDKNLKTKRSSTQKWINLVFRFHQIFNQDTLERNRAKSNQIGKYKKVILISFIKNNKHNITLQKSLNGCKTQLPKKLIIWTK